MTIAQGKKLSTIEDVIYDPQQNRVKALLVDKGGWFADAKIILIHDATSIGEDAVMIEDENKIKKAEEVKDGVAAVAKDDNYLTKTKVIAEDGKELGKVSDIYFDTNTGDVEEFEVSQGFMKNMQSGKKKFKVAEIVSVGKDATIVKSYTEEKFEEQGQQQGVQGAVNKTRQKATSRETKDSINNFMDRTHDKLQELGQKAKDKVEEVKTSSKTQETLGSVNEKVREGKDRIKEQRKQDALGKYLTVNIISPADKMIARRGDIVTHDLIGQAETVGVLDKVLNNTSSEPLSRVPDHNVPKDKHIT